MDDRDAALIQKLCQENPEFKKHYEEHLEFEKQLDKLNSFRYLTPEEDLERKRIQKLKLKGKEQMELILSRARAEK